MTVRWAKRNDVAAINHFYERCKKHHRNVLYLERHHDFFESYKTEGAESHILVADGKTPTQIGGIGAISYKPVYVNGSENPVTCGYLSSLELEAGNVRALQRGYAELRKRSFEKGCSLHLTTIMSENHYGRAVLSSHRLGIPEYRSLGKIKTLLFNAATLKKIIRDDGATELRVTKPELSNEQEIDHFIKSIGSLWQVFPAYSFRDLAGIGSLPKTSLSNLIILRDANRIRGLAMLWDVEELKRWRVADSRGFGHAATLLRRLALKIRRLPDIFSKAHRILFIAARLVRPGDQIVFVKLLHALSDLAPRGVSLCMAIHESDPFIEVMDRIPAICFTSELFSVSLACQEIELDDRPFYLEAGAL